MMLHCNLYDKQLRKSVSEYINNGLHLAQNRYCMLAMDTSLWTLSVLRSKQFSDSVACLSKTVKTCAVFSKLGDRYFISEV